MLVHKGNGNRVRRVEEQTHAISKIPVEGLLHSSSVLALRTLQKRLVWCESDGSEWKQELTYVKGFEPRWSWLNRTPPTTNDKNAN
jgi:hypothetical protein